MSCPLIKRHVHLQANVAGISSASAFGTMTVTRSFNTLEERVAELERQLAENRELILEKERVLVGKLEATKTELYQALDKHGAKVQDLSRKLEVAAVGGLKSQAFGVLLAVYGAVVGIFA